MEYQITDLFDRELTRLENTGSHVISVGAMGSRLRDLEAAILETVRAHAANHEETVVSLVTERNNRAKLASTLLDIVRASEDALKAIR